MTYKLFIDDLRDPVTNDWKVARSSAEAKDIVVEFVCRFCQDQNRDNR